MTTIAWDGKRLVADRRCTDRVGIKREVKRLLEVGGYAVGAAGEVAHIAQLIAWMAAGQTAATLPTFKEEEFPSAIAIELATGRPWVIYGERPCLSEIWEPFFAVGSGRELAKGAMAMGADAKAAVLVAHRFDVWTGDVVDILEVPTWARQ